MSNYRRYFVPGGTYFLTLVTYARRPILTSSEGRTFLRQAIDTVRECHPFALTATVLMPDHWHLVMQLPEGEDGYSLRVRQIKAGFSERWLAHGLSEAAVTESQHRRGERGIWQPRFWEHRITDEEDLERCVDYIHWNPRKHGLVDRVADWPFSSFHRFVESGQYEADWGGVAPTGINNRDWGE